MDTLLFVYNADSGVFAVASDFVKKIAAPSKYQCNLCAITYGNLTMKEEWKLFLDSLPQKKEFLHRDEMKDHYPDLADTPLPAIFLIKENGPELLLSADEINQQKTIADLKELLQHKLDSSLK